MATNMNMDFGYYTSTGGSVYLPIRSDVDYFELMNYTPMATTATPGRIVRASWQRGFASDYALTSTKTNASNAINETIATSGGFTLVDTSTQTGQFGSAVVTTGVTNASPPVVSTATTTGLVDGSTVVQLASTSGNYQLAGMQFTVGTVVASTSFALKYMGAPGDAAPGNGTYRVVNWDAMYAPRRRLITSMTAASQAVITLSVTHNFVVGEWVQIIMPTAYGMKEANNKIVKITAINTTTNTITVDLNSSSYTAFAFPRTSVVPFTFAQVLPVGEIPTISTQATRNESRLAMLINTGVGGSDGDQIFWRAWTAFKYNTSFPSA